MSESDQSQEKTEQPTQRKLEKAREDGQVPRSKELTTTAVLLAAALGLLWFGGSLTETLSDIFRFNYSLPREVIFDTTMMSEYLIAAFADALLGLLPLFAILLIAAILGPVALGGWLLSAKSLMPKFSRMNPIEGIKRMFSAKSLVELGKAVAKVALMLLLATMLLYALEGKLRALAMEDVETAIKHSAVISAWVAIALSAATILIAIIDVPFQIWDCISEVS